MATQLDAAAALDWAFAKPRTAKLATVRADGSPHVAPVWVARDGDRIVFNTGATTLKGRSLARDPRVSMAFDDEAPPFGFVLIDGTVEISEEPDPLVHWATEIAKRYMGDDKAEAYGRRNGVPGELLVFVTPTKVRGMLDVAD
jgi:PPOX class probable F420-dependent enzyme